MSFIKKIRDLLGKRLSGVKRTRQIEHPYFGRMTFMEFESGEPYWEAEVPIAEPAGKVSVQLSGTPDGPTDAEERFCRTNLSNPDALFERCRDAFARDYPQWAARMMPANWREGFELEGLSVPPGGDAAAEWEVTYFVPAANHWFTAMFRGREVADVRIDG